MKGISLEITQHQIEFDTIIPPTHQVRYQLNPNYVAIIKHDIDKLLASCLIKHVEEATSLPPIMIVLKKMAK